MIRMFAAPAADESAAFSIDNPRGCRTHYYREVVYVDSADYRDLFFETGEPMAYLLYAAAYEQETAEAEDEVLPSA